MGYGGPAARRTPPSLRYRPLPVQTARYGHPSSSFGSGRSMSQLLPALREIAPGIEKELKGRLASFVGMFIVGYLPQTWSFATDAGSATLTVDKKGTVVVEAGTPANPDVTVEWGHDALIATLLRQKRAPAAGDPPLRVTPHTSKGKTAYDFLRSRFGL